MPIHKKVNKEFFKIWTPDMAYVLGFFAADGYIIKNKRGANFWCIEISDKELLENIKKVIGSEHKISLRPMRENCLQLYRLQIGSKEMCEDLSKLGFIQAKTKRMTVPHIPTTYQGDFVRGYFDGDGNIWSGYIHKERLTPTLILRTTFTSCSVVFLSGIQGILKSEGISSVLSKGKGNFYRLICNGKDSLKLYNFMYNHSVLDENSLFLYRKKIIFEDFIKMRP